MATFFAYFSVVLIWATTPLAIQWSSDSLSAIAAVVARMGIALALALIINAFLRRQLFTQPHQWKIYLAASIGIFPNMPVVYWAAQFIPSGLVAVIFSLSPFATGLMTFLLLKENPFSLKRVLALVIAFMGLTVIFYHQMQFDKQSVFGMAGILLSCFLFSFSSVWVKKLTVQYPEARADAFNQAVGSLLFSLPGLLLAWWLWDGELPQQVTSKSVGSVVYLAVMGSLVGAALFFYILQRLSATVVSLITLMTPVLAILIGKWVANEELAFHTEVGIGIVLIALLLYMPWSWAAISHQLALWGQRSLVTRELDTRENPQAALQDAKDAFIRHK